MNRKKTLYDKIFDLHIIKKIGDNYLIKIDKMPGHEVTSAQAFAEMEQANRQPWNKNSLLFVEDHNTPTDGGYEKITDLNSKKQIDTLRENVKKYDLPYFYPLGDQGNGIIHVVAPETGFVLPGNTSVCGDSHTATYGAYGALAFGVGTSEVSVVLQTGSLKVEKLKNMRVVVNGKLKPFVTSKDVILYIISKLGTGFGTGYAVEFVGDVFEDMSVEARMTVSNMAIEGGAKVGLVAVDDKVIDYFEGRVLSPKGEEFERFKEFAKTLHSDEGAVFDKEYYFDAEDITPQVSWGTTPAETVGVLEAVPENASDESLEYIGLQKGQKMTDFDIENVFLGSCTNSRIEDLRLAASILKKIGKKKSDKVKQVLVVPGSMKVKIQAEQEGLDVIFKEAGFEWRNPGCSACLAMNNDIMPEYEHTASTSNRNFRDRQGKNARTHLCSPIMAMIAAVYGSFKNPEDVIK